MANIDINKIIIVNGNPRRAFDLDKLKELAESIKERGIIQPLACKKVGSEYHLITGERRLRAAKMVGLKEVPIVVRETEESDIKIEQVIENLQREDLSAEDKFLAFKRMRDNGLTIKEISKKAGVIAKGPIPLPTKRLKVTTRKSPCGDGTATFDRFEMRIHKRVIDLPSNDRVLHSIMRLPIPKTVNIKIEMKD